MIHLVVSSFHTSFEETTFFLIPKSSMMKKFILFVICLLGILTLAVTANAQHVNHDHYGNPNCQVGDVLPIDSWSLSMTDAVYNCPYKGLCSWGSSTDLHICDCHFDENGDILLTRIIDMNQIWFVPHEADQLWVEVHENELWIAFREGGITGVRKWKFSLAEKRMVRIDSYQIKE
jgi:hypothetical protein